jgi:septal ring factor EnvC (AmiA/AmiB activator)
MADVTNELMYEVLKQIQSDVAGLKDGQREIATSLNAVRSHLTALHQDVSNIYTILVRHETRLDRIERRLQIAEVTG